MTYPSFPAESIPELRAAARSDLNVPQEIPVGSEESVRNLFPPERIVGGRYIIEERVGEGGMGRIFKVRHRDLGKVFALKIIHATLAEQQHIRDAFYREARLASSFTHPNIVSVVDYGIDSHHGAFIVMEYLTGETLADRLARERTIPPKGACDIVLQCAEALHFIHTMGVIHCDIKPENVFLCQTGEMRRNLVRLLDFGLASRPQVDAAEIVAATTVAGTPTYLAPERIQARPPTPASDIYALGVLFYECLTGQPPFEGRLQDILHGHLRVDPVPPSRLLGRGEPPLDPNLEALVLRALAKDPAARHRSAADFAFELRQIMEDMGLARRRRDTVSIAPSPRADLCESLVDACPLPMFVASPTCEMLFGNPSFGNLIGIPPDELKGKLGQTPLGTWCPKIERDVRQVLARGRTIRRALVIHGKYGEARGGWLTLAPFRREGAIVGVCGVVSVMGEADPEDSDSQIRIPVR
ncbi:MAG: protein kinase [Myxococcales bacterium]|nr:protein kinase [Myxococcota bacterium]MDW8280282.1 protein kinase [Myxococcales bacterium]